MLSFLVQGASHLTDDANAKLVNRMNSLDLHVVREGEHSDCLAQVERPIRDALQRQGYFRVFLRRRLQPHLVRGPRAALPDNHRNRQRPPIPFVPNRFFWYDSFCDSGVEGAILTTTWGLV